MALETVLVVEDELKLAALLADYLGQAGYRVEQLHDGAAVVEWVQANPVQAILLDIMLPNKDGLQICREIRRFSQVPILMVTARVDEIDRLLGLELEADDYICKPFSPREVVARVKTVLRRARGGLADDASAELPGLKLDEERLQASFEQRRTELTAVEFQLLQRLVTRPGRIFSRQQLMQQMYRDNRVVSDRTIDSHIKKIRRKLQELDPEREFIHSIYGAGYKYEFD